MCGPQQAYPQHSIGVQLKLCTSKLCDFRSFSNWPPLTAKAKLWELVGMGPSEPACTSECLCDVNMADRLLFFVFLFFPRMRERDLQSMCRRVLLLTICMVSLWGQLSSASSHRSHIGTALHVFFVVTFPGHLSQNNQCLRLLADHQLHCRSWD